MRTPTLLASLALALALLASPSPARAHEDDPHVCGDGVREAEEECDDGNQVDDDTCHDDCTLNCSAEDYPSTFAAIQGVVFDGYDCNNLICHSAAAASLSGDLNLESAHSYVGLLGASGTGAASAGNLLKRVEPSEPELSFLYLKLLAKTDPARLAEIHSGGVGTPMPSNLLTLTDPHLEAVRRWIRGGAPEHDVVEGTSELLGTCLPPPDPLKIPIPAPPAVDGQGDATGFQLRQPPWPLAANTVDEQGEDEICMATYYDLTASDLIPDWAKVPCPEGFQHRKRCSDSSETAPVTCTEDVECTGQGATCVPFRNTTNPTSQCILWHKQVLYQDPQSHHSIIHVYAGASETSDPGWGDWTYKLEPDDPDHATKHGLPCDPTDVDPSLGYNPGCSGSVVSSVACIGYGPDDNSQLSLVGGGGNFPAIVTSQEPYYSQELDDGVFAVLPAAAIVGWNSHAFNLTDTPSTMAQYLNLEYARPEDQEHFVRGIFQADAIAAQNVPPFETREICATQTLPRGSRLFQLSSHTHLRGVQWRTWGPPNTPCQPKCPGYPGNDTCVFGGFFCTCEPYGTCSNDDAENCDEDEDCTGGVCQLLPFCDELGYPREEAPLYFSTDYSDPLQLDVRPAMELDSPDVADRTLLFCSVYDNGSTDLSPPVKRWSQSPVPPDITINFTGFPITVPGEQLEPALGGPCHFTRLACLDGPQKGEICGIYDNPDGFCGAPGLCDACPVHGGVTTEDEMFILMGSYYVPEAGTPIAGDRLLLKTGSGRFVFKTKDEGVTASGDPATEGASLVVSAADPALGSTGTIELDPGRWKALRRKGEVIGYRYKDRSRSRGGVSSVVLKNGRLKIVAGGDAWPWQLSEAPGGVWVRFSVGDASWCARFAGDNARVEKNEPHLFEANDASAPGSCSAP